MKYWKLEETAAPGELLAVNFYRHDTQPGFSGREIDVLGYLSEIVLASLGKHIELTGVPGHRQSMEDMLARLPMLPRSAAQGAAGLRAVGAGVDLRWHCCRSGTVGVYRQDLPQSSLPAFRHSLPPGVAGAFDVGGSEVDRATFAERLRYARLVARNLLR